VFFDRGGNFAAQFMKRDRSTTAPAAAAAVRTTRAVGGYDAYFGTYRIDEEQGVDDDAARALAHEHVAP
jgi:hypothetical protein